MEISETLHVINRKEWRAWLRKNHRIAPDIWLVFYKKHTGRPRIPQNDAVEEALCYGWIDSIVKPINRDCFAQRFSPRRKNSVLSELNKERIRRLIKSRKMTRFGLESVNHHLKSGFHLPALSKKPKPLKLPSDIQKRLREDAVVWRNFTAFPESYRRIRIGWIESARSRPDVFETRLRYFVKMTAKNKRYGMLQ